jgi:hypothetical protein
MDGIVATIAELLTTHFCLCPEEIGWEISQLDIQSRCFVWNLDSYGCHFGKVDPKEGRQMGK